MDHFSRAPTITIRHASIYAEHIHGGLELDQLSHPTKLLSWKDKPSCNPSPLHNKCDD